jgi:hypothetical protein
LGRKDIEAVVRCWELSGTSTLNAGATPEELKDAARTLGRDLPDELVALYSHCNGGDVLEGNIDLYPVDGEELSLVQGSDFLRRYKWPISQEVIVFAGDGQGGSFGLWLPRDQIGRPFVVEVGEIFEEGSLAITGTSLSGFLRGRSAYYAFLLESPDDASRSLGVPEQFTPKRADELHDQYYEALMRWANPDLPEFPVSSYEARLTADDVRRFAKGYG